MLRLFLRLLVLPGSTIDRILARPPGFARLTVWVAALGALRGAVEGLWILLMAGQFGALLALGQGRVAAWYLDAAGPFLLANLLTGLFRWGLFAIVPYALGRFAGGGGRWRDFLRVYGVAMGIYVVTILPNYAYLGWDLPTIRFDVSRSYNPLLGVGQLLTSLWLAWFSFVAARRLHRLPRFEAAMVGLAVPLTNLALFVVASRVFFNLRPLVALARAELFWFSTAAFIVAALVAIPILFLAGGWFARSERAAARPSLHAEEGA